MRPLSLVICRNISGVMSLSLLVLKGGGSHGSRVLSKPSLFQREYTIKICYNSISVHRAISKVKCSYSKVRYLLNGIPIHNIKHSYNYIFILLLDTELFNEWNRWGLDATLINFNSSKLILNLISPFHFLAANKHIWLNSLPCKWEIHDSNMCHKTCSHNYFYLFLWFQSIPSGKMLEYFLKLGHNWLHISVYSTFITVLPLVLHKVMKQTIFNADDAGLFYSLLYI